MKPFIIPIALSSMVSSSFYTYAQSDSEPTASATTVSDFSIERVLVTADHFSQQVQDLSATVSVLDAALITSRQAEHLEDMLSVVPNLNMTSGASRGRFIQIRGIGERSQFGEPINPSVALVLDDIDFSGIGALGGLFDVQQVEVLSGPQSTGFGANGLAGLVKVVSQQPSEQASGVLRASIGEYQNSQLSGAYSGALSSNLLARVALQETRSDGFVKNAHLSRNDTNGLNESAAKLLLNYRLSTQTSMRANFYHFNIDNGYDAFSLDNDNISQADEPGFDRTDADALSLGINTQFDGFTLDAAVTALSADLDYGYDEDWTFEGFHPDGYSSFDRYLRGIDNRTIDIKLVSNEGGAYEGINSNAWVIGVYYKDSEQDLTRLYTYNPVNFTSTYSPSSSAIYGEYQWQLADDLSVISGARLEQFSANYSDLSGYEEGLDDTLIALKAAVNYQIGDTRLFANLSRGYKAGGFNPDQRVAQADRLFKPEYNWNVEAGLKGRLLQSEQQTLAELSITLFYMQREDAQVSDFAVLPRLDNINAVEFIDVVSNADTGTNKGLELQSTWYLLDNLDVQANIGYLDATFGNYEAANGTYIPKQAQAQAPKWTGYIAANVQFMAAFTWTTELELKDPYRFSIGHDEIADSTAVLNSRVTWQSDHWQLSAWAKNIFDERIQTRGFGGFSNDPRDGYFPAEPYYQFGQPRQVGVSARYEF